MSMDNLCHASDYKAKELRDLGRIFNIAKKTLLAVSKASSLRDP
jgi:hypothetical protein